MEYDIHIASILVAKNKTTPHVQNLIIRVRGHISELRTAAEKMDKTRIKKLLHNKATRLEDLLDLALSPMGNDSGN